MRKISFTSVLFFAMAYINAQVNPGLAAYAREMSYNKQKQLSFISFKETYRVNESDVSEFINSMILNNSNNKVAVFKIDKDSYGFSHTKYNVVQNGIPVFAKIIIAHCRDGKLNSLNGDLRAFSEPSNHFSLTEKSALEYALKKIHAKKYKWENKAEEAHMSEVLNKPGFTYYPEGVKVIYEKGGKLFNAFRFDIYAEEPLYRANVFVDASSGKILGEQSLICNIDVPATAGTKYSGSRAITCDQGTTYTLKETQRGLGVETYNMNHTSTYSSTNFTNSSTTWTTVSTNTNQAATDAHWGAESTYDFYSTKFNINSIDNAGYKLLSYLHYTNNYNNAFWDGIRMTYGDGNGTQFTILTALDVCGHEITHGLVSNTANLGGSGTDECDALNEGFADIFGTSIERFARPTNWNWIMGSDITPNGNGIRNMANPKALQDPDTYTGQYWDAAGEPHNNAGPCIKWFYLLINGGSATNDLGSTYTVTGLGNVDAEKIAYRALTVYFTPNTDYADARIAAVQAAKDLFGNCSSQAEQTARAWYAVGVGAAYSNTVIGPNFQADITNFCTLPATVNFNNTTSNGQSYTWDFGDGSAAATASAVHNYTANGTYSVKLKATGCSNGLDSITKPSYIVINVPATPLAMGGAGCANTQITLNASGSDQLNWYASPGSTVVLGTGGSFITPALNASSTFYVVNTFSNTPAFGGILTNTGGGNLNNNAQSLIFDVIQNSVLNTVVVYAQNAGARTIELRNSLGSILSSTVVTLAAGANTVTLNFNLTLGTNYELGLSTTSASNLYRSNTGVAYPYGIGNCVNITSSTAGGGFYYWFYNWKVTKAACMSPAVAVTASITPAPLVSISVPSTELCNDYAPVSLSGNPAGGIFSGSGTNGSSFDPSIGAGTYNIVYTYSDVNGCMNSDSVSMNVMICTGIASLNIAGNSLAIYPNPAADHVIIKNDLSGQANVFIADASGRLVLSQKISSKEETIDVNNLARGLYVLSVKDFSGTTIKTVKLVKE